MIKAARAALLFALSLVVSLLVFVPYANDAYANGKPIKIVLTYMPGLSNWGPAEATGLAEVVMKEGEVNIAVVGLPPLTGEVYTGWILNTRNEQLMQIGAFNTDPSEVARVKVILPSEIPDSGWNLFLVSVEPNGQAGEAPGERKTVAGYFPEPVEVKSAPPVLPKAGGDTDPAGTRANPPYPPVKTISPANKGFSISSLLDNNYLTYGVVLLAVFGLGFWTRTGVRRK